MYIPAWPTLSPAQFLRRSAARGIPFPLDAPGGIYFYVARSGIYRLMRALELGDDEFVLMPDYHSGVEVWAVRAAGARVRYYHVRRDLTFDLDEVRDLSRGCRVFYLIHYFGWPQPMAEIAALCRERGMILFEDCALALLGRYGGRPLGTFGDYSIFCLYKTLPVPNGGLLIQNAASRLDAERLKLRPADSLSTAARMADLMLHGVRIRAELFGKGILTAKHIGGSALTTLGFTRLPVGDISPDFRSEGCDIQKTDIEMSAVCRSLLARFDYASIYETRRRNFLHLQERLNDGAPPLGKALEDGVCPLFFPLLVPDKRAAARALAERGVGTVELWNYGYPEAEDHTLPDARFLRRHALEIPIHQDLGASQIDYVADQIRDLNLDCDSARRRKSAQTTPVLEKIAATESFRRLRSEWDELLEASEANCFFLTWEWLFSWWRHLSGGRTLFILTVRAEEKLIAIAPLVLKQARVGGLWPFRALEFLGAGAAGSDYLDLILRRGREETALKALEKYLAEHELTLELAQVRKRGSAAARLADRLRERGGWRSFELATDVCPHIDLSGRTWESYLATLGAAHRQNVQRRLRQLHKAFSVRFERTTEEGQRAEAMAALMDLHYKRWREREPSEAFATPDFRAFHEEISRRALERGWLRLFILKLEDKPAAALYGFRRGRTFYFFQSGFDPAYAKHSIGLVTMGLAIESAIEEGVGEYDLLHGNESYKSLWARETREIGSLELYPPSAAGLFYRQVASFGRLARKTGRAILPKGVADKIAAARRTAMLKDYYAAPAR